MSAPTLALVGLGNPGAQYERHRHNVGFMAVDAIARHFSFSDEKKKFRGLLREGTIKTQSQSVRALILKPQTFMNESGKSVTELARFYKISPEAIIVFHDELDLKPGKVRTKIGGGNAGHNGLRSIDQHIGNGFVRIRLGIGHPGDKARVHGHVLGDFAKSDAEWLDPMLDALARAAPQLCQPDEVGLSRYQTEVAQLLNPNAHAPKSASAQSDRKKADGKKQKARAEDAPKPEPTGEAERTGGSEPTGDKPQTRNAFSDALQGFLSKKK